MSERSWEIAIKDSQRIPDPQIPAPKVLITPLESTLN